MTTIVFGLSEPASVSLEIFDSAGRLVRVLADGRYDAGMHEKIWNGRDLHGRPAASGVYFCRLSTANLNISRKMILIR
jgi:flagellar hook assembly protein FlgD